MRFISNLGWIQLYLLLWEELCVQVTIVTFMVGWVFGGRGASRTLFIWFESVYFCYEWLLFSMLNHFFFHLYFGYTEICV